MELLADPARRGRDRVAVAVRIPRVAGAHVRQYLCRRCAGRRAQVPELRHRRADARVLAQLPDGTRAVPRRDLRADDVRAARHDGDDFGQSFPAAVSRAGADVAVAVRDDCAATGIGPGGRSGDEILRPRRARFRPAALRHVDDLRRDRDPRRRARRHDCFRRRRQQDHAGFRPGIRRLGDRVQARRRAVPHVGARRVRGRADGDDAVRRRGARSSPRSAS